MREGNDAHFYVGYDPRRFGFGVRGTPSGRIRLTLGHDGQAAPSTAKVGPGGVEASSRVLQEACRLHGEGTRGVSEIAEVERGRTGKEARPAGEGAREIYGR